MLIQEGETATKVLYISEAYQSIPAICRLMIRSHNTFGAFKPESGAALFKTSPLGPYSLGVFDLHQHHGNTPLRNIENCQLPEDIQISLNYQNFLPNLSVMLRSEAILITYSLPSISIIFGSFTPLVSAENDQRVRTLSTTILHTPLGMNPNYALEELKKAAQKFIV